MTNFHEIFENRHAILPVIHVKSAKSTINNAAIAHKAGCDGIFLINMKNQNTLDRMNHQELRKIQRIIRLEYPTWWIGVNYLDLPADEVFAQVDSQISGVWVDNAHIDEWAKTQIEAKKIEQARKLSGWSGLYFGGVAFKYQPNVDNPAFAAKIATTYMDVVTTSGTGTGSAPDLPKITAMKDAIGSFPLAIASGISVSNVANFLPIADAFIVASSILVPETDNFDPAKVKELVDVVRNYR